MVLTPNQRKLFIEYLVKSILGGEKMVAEFSRNRVPAELIKREKTKLLGYRIVLQDLEAAEEQTISS